jgi:hypothetical protein
MKRILSWTVVAILVGACTALAQSGSTSGSASGQTQGQTQVTGEAASANAAAEAMAKAAAQAKFERLREEIQTKGAKVSEAARTRAETKLETSAKAVDAEGGKTPHGIAQRLSSEFELSAEALAEERQLLGVSWGQLMIAHTLAANANSDVTVEQLIQMRKDGMGWGQIAGGLDLTMGDVVSAVNAEAGVALGRAAPDGKVAVIHGPGARAGVGTGLKAGAGLGTKGKGAAVGASVEAGGKIKP